MITRIETLSSGCIVLSLLMGSVLGERPRPTEAPPRARAYRLFLEGTALARDGRLAAARKKLEEVLALDPEAAPVHSALARLCLRESDHAWAPSRLECKAHAPWPLPMPTRRLTGCWPAWPSGNTAEVMTRPCWRRRSPTWRRRRGSSRPMAGPGRSGCGCWSPKTARTRPWPWLAGPPALRGSIRPSPGSPWPGNS
ncbi:MAG: hypothetical protein Q9Q13_10690 [Acidobacteriota bacterium]|nr:hypothetical protein [Acidobacteriota bacterium]